jgi:prophage DNA circulation protein
MSWRDRLRPASWRGVPFWVDSAELSTGRVGDDHVYPGSDRHYAEDASRAPTQASIAGYLIGADHDEDARSLFAALAQAGPGELVHPWYGTLTGIARKGSVSQSRLEGGFTRVAIDFVESGDPSYPVASTLTLDTVDVSAADAESAAAAAFAEAWSVIGETGYIVGRATGTLNGWKARVESKSGRVAELVKDIATLPLAAPETLSDLVLDVFAQFSTLAGLRDLYGTAPTEAPPTAGSAEEQTATDNDTAFQRLSERAALAQAARVSAATDWTIYDDALTARDELSDRLAAEGQTDQGFTGPAETLRAAVLADLDDRLTDLARLRTEDVKATTDALALAWRLYGDPSRADEIADLNDLPHPGFLDGAVTVLSR